MKKKDVLKYYGGSARAVAKALDISVQYVSQWPAKVPEVQAARLEKVTNRDLEYKLADYP